MIRVVGGVLIKKDKVTLAKRASSLKNFPDFYEFPGGKIDINESPKEALIRELREELEIEVTECDIEEFEGNIVKSFIEKNRKIIHLTVFIVSNWKGNITINPSIHSELVTIPIKILDSFNGLIPADAKLVPVIQNQFK